MVEIKIQDETYNIPTEWKDITDGNTLQESRRGI
jgi:hypothetical protein